MGKGGERPAWADSWLASVASFVAAILIVLREPIRSGFDRGFGDRADALIAISIQEHWRNVLSGAERWNKTLYFHPYADTLGYNDGYFLSGLIYSVWRIFADPLLADTLTVASWKAIGFVGTWWLVRRTFGFRPVVASCTALMFTIANGMFIQAEHGQLNTVALLPLAMILAVEATRAEVGGLKRRARVLAVALAALLGAWLLTAYYTAWFTLWFTLVFTIAWVLLERPNIVSLARRHGTTAAIFAAAFVVASLPFLLVYLPKVEETGAHEFIRRFMVLPRDTFNVGPQNIAWGWLIRLLRPAALRTSMDETSFNGEHETGFPLLLLAIVLFSAYKAVGPKQLPIVRALALSVLVSWVLTMKLGSVYPWRLVYAVVPGAKGLRVVLRYQLFLILPALLLVLAANRERLGRWTKRAPLLTGALALLLIFEQLNGADFARLPRRATLHELAAVPTPPQGCESFYAVSARRNPPGSGELIYGLANWRSLYPHNVDAMVLSELWRVPTINGFSTFNPPDWNFADSLAGDYDDRAAAFARTHHLSGLCRLDARQPQPWTILRIR